MKITQIQLISFHQFRNLTINLTYPKGHPREGRPLDKVCFIGQSGTGKTTLLKWIQAQVADNSFLEVLADEMEAYKAKEISFRLETGKLSFQTSFQYDSDDGSHYWDWISRGTLMNGVWTPVEKAQEYFAMTESTIERRSIFFPADLDYDANQKSTNLSLLRDVDFRELVASDVWRLVLDAVEAYQEEEIKRKQTIADLVVSAATIDTAKVQEAITKFEEWKRAFPNPIVVLAEDCLDRVLSPLNLRVHREFVFEKKEDIGVVKIEDKNGNIVPYDLLSTGTKQIMLTAIPLFYLNPEKTVILCDEPERSLYPSMQRFIIDFYTSLTKDCQFFYATHSPIIASCFEPWEIVELKFNDEGYVVQDLYYKGERHVNNYTIIPSYLTYDLMLKKVFDLEETHPEERSEKITEVLTMRNELDELKKAGKMKTPEAKALYERYKDLAGKLFWDFETFERRHATV